MSGQDHAPRDHEDMRLGESWTTIHLRCAFSLEPEHDESTDIEIEQDSGIAERGPTNLRPAFDLAVEIGWRDINPDGWICPTCAKRLEVE